MKLQHNLGGLEGLGPVEFEKRVFVESWEQRIFGIHVAMMGLSQHLDAAKATPTKFKDVWTWADLRQGAEAMNPFDYFKYRYYEKWLGGICEFWLEKGYISPSELEAKTAMYLEKADAPQPASSESAIDDQVIEYLRTGDPAIRDVDRQPKFSAGQTVKIRDIHPVEHTRLPGYLRNKTGIVDVVYEGCYTYFCSTGPDGLGEPMPVYCVRFAPQDIWGKMAEPNSSVYADLYEVYLEAAA